MTELSNPDTRHRQVQIEDLHIRNYDDEEHLLWIRAVTKAGNVVFERFYLLASHESASELNELSSGTYDIEVELNGVHQWAQRREITDDSARGLLVEIGNGTVSITTSGRNINTENDG